MCHKIDTVYTLVDRAILLAKLPTDPNFHQKNFCVNILIANNYPLQFIFKIINRRLRKLFVTKLNKSVKCTVFNDNVQKLSTHYFVSPYTPTINNHNKQFNLEKINWPM